MTELNFKYKINSKDLAKVSMHILFKNRIFYYIPAFLILIACINSYNKIKNGSVELMTTVIPFAITLLILVLVFYKVKSNSIKNIEKSPRIKEYIQYTISKEFIEEKGETFEIKHFWKNVKKIKETDAWFLIYLNKYQALPLFKKQISNNKINDLRLILNQLKTPKSLKSNI